MWDLISWPGIESWPPALGACSNNHWTTSPCLGFWFYVFYCACVLSSISCVWLFATLWTVACQAPLSMWFSRQEYWSGLPCTPQGDLPNSGMEPGSLMFPALAGRFFTTSATQAIRLRKWISSQLPNECHCSSLLPKIYLKPPRGEK